MNYLARLFNASNLTLFCGLTAGKRVKFDEIYAACSRNQILFCRVGSQI
ncbi:hypothetical protein H7R39_00580 [Campylobacter sp. Marseille-Q3452]|uniref:Uncharacterized protein n=1 Tax=Campylobacter massiliensis TaxID=2762557 RepID=A0A842J202_9BACT|nr:hypothetical protein [Campylobacter massiliensis]MBC2881787.1 hypothetical protein [Campylobacter massiliensis]